MSVKLIVHPGLLIINGKLQLNIFFVHLFLVVFFNRFNKFPQWWQLCVTVKASHNELRRQHADGKPISTEARQGNSDIHVLFVCVLLISPFISSVFWLMACSAASSTSWQREKDSSCKPLMSR